MHPGILLLSFLLIRLTSADFLQNPDFETPPPTLVANKTTPFVELKENDTIPGWTFEGKVQYVTATQNLTLPDNGHAIQLGQDGKIGQSFIANGEDMNYLLTITLAPGGLNCSENADVEVSAPDSHAIISLKQSYGKQTWESYGFYLGRWGRNESVDLVIQSQTRETKDANSTCWPVIDMLLLKSDRTLVQWNNNLFPNGGFEVGPEFLRNSTEGILLDSTPSPVQSALQHWSIIGTVKYIDSNNFFVSEGNAAVEIVSGVSTGLQTAVRLTEGLTYNLDFILGDANDACEGDFIVGVQAGSSVQNITLRVVGTGSAIKYSMKFEAASGLTTVSFLSYKTSRNKDGLFCGPVVDDVILRVSRGVKLELKLKILICVLVLALIL